MSSGLPTAPMRRSVCVNSAHASTTLSVCQRSKKEATRSAEKIETRKKAKRSSPKDDSRLVSPQPRSSGMAAAYDVMAKNIKTQ